MVKDTKRHRMNEFSYYVYIYIYIFVCACRCRRVGAAAVSLFEKLKYACACSIVSPHASQRVHSCPSFFCPFPFKGSEEASRASLFKCEQLLLRTPPPPCLTKAQTSMCGDEGAEKKCASPEKGQRRATKRQQKSPQRAQQTATRVSVAHVRGKTAGKKKRSSKSKHKK